LLKKAGAMDKLSLDDEELQKSGRCSLKEEIPSKEDAFPFPSVGYVRSQESNMF